MDYQFWPETPTIVSKQVIEFKVNEVMVTLVIDVSSIGRTLPVIISADSKEKFAVSFPHTEGKL